MIAKRKYIVNDGLTGDFEVFPGNTAKAPYTYARDLDSGQIFYRKELSGKLVFSNRNGSMAFEYFKNKELDPENRCQRIDLSVFVFCEGAYKEEWKGYFSTGNGTFNFDTCTFEVKPTVSDAYSCILIDQDYEVNILDVEAIVTTTAVIETNFEYHVYRDDKTIAFNTFLAAANNSLPPITDSWMVLTHEINFYDQVMIYFRERSTIACVGGSPEPPQEDAGWFLLTSDCGGSNLATFVRRPVGYTDSYDREGIHEGSCDSGELPPPKVEYLPVYFNDDWDAADTNMYIWGYNSVDHDSTSVVYEVMNPPVDATFSWDFQGVINQPSFSSGTTSVQATVDFDGLFVGNFCTIRCEVTSPCGGIKTVELYIKIGSAAAANPTLVQGPAYVCPGETEVHFIIPIFPDDDWEGDVIWTDGPNCSIISGQGTREIVVDINPNATQGPLKLKGQYSYFDSSGGGGQYVNFETQCRVSIPALTGPISGPQGVCDGGDATYSVYNRAGSTYEWNVQGGVLISGQGTNTVVIQWQEPEDNPMVWVKETQSGGCVCDYILVAPCLDLNPPYYWCNTVSHITYDRNRYLMAALEYILSQGDCGITTVRSDFFEWNPVGDAPGFTTGINYVTGLANQMNHVTIAQKSDIVTPTSSEPATKGITTLERMLDWLRIVFNVWWDINDQNEMRVEHASFFSRNTGWDLTDAYYKQQVAGKNEYSHISEELPKYERFKMMEAKNADFIGAEIIYETQCASTLKKSNRREYSADEITTDLQYIFETPSEIDLDGFVLFANEDLGDVLGVISDVGALSGNVIINAPLSWANLHRDFHRHFRFNRSGIMNNQDTVFLSFRNTIKQTEIKIKPEVCCDILRFNPSDLITTPLGEILGGITALVEKAEHNTQENTLKLTLGYPY